MAAAAPILALLSGAISLAGLLGAYLGLVAPLTGFMTFTAGALAGGALSLLVSLVAIFVSRGDRNPDGVKLGAAGLVASIGLLLIVFVAASPGRGLPPINDITTDLESPPSFASESLVPDYAGRDMSYPEEFKAQVVAAYADLAPLRLASTPGEAYAKALATAESLGWTITARRPDELSFDAREETALFHFVDDVTVRVTAEGHGSRLDVRSKSRDGRGDLGANAARIRRYLEAFRA